MKAFLLASLAVASLTGSLNAASCSWGGETFTVCTQTSDIWGFENGGICIGKQTCGTPATMPPSTTARPPTSPTTTAKPPTSGGSPLWGQCGGSGYTGPTTCSQGRCVKSNEWYSQCIP